MCVLFTKTFIEGNIPNIKKGIQHEIRIQKIKQIDTFSRITAGMQ